MARTEETTDFTRWEISVEGGTVVLTLEGPNAIITLPFSPEDAETIGDSLFVQARIARGDEE